MQKRTKELCEALFASHSSVRRRLFIVNGAKKPIFAVFTAKKKSLKSHIAFIFLIVLRFLKSYDIIKKKLFFNATARLSLCVAIAKQEASRLFADYFI